MSYWPFFAAPIPDDIEMDPRFGPGIRSTAGGDPYLDKTIEAHVELAPAGRFVLRRTSPTLRVWLTPDRQPGTEVVFQGQRTGPLGSATDGFNAFWVEWAGPASGTADLVLESACGGAELDHVRFRPFRSLVAVIGGERQHIGDGSGMWIFATNLYVRSGYDVYMF